MTYGYSSAHADFSIARRQARGATHAYVAVGADGGRVDLACESRHGLRLTPTSQQAACSCRALDTFARAINAEWPDMLTKIWGVTSEVRDFCSNRAWAWWTKKNPRDELLEALSAATTYEEWEELAFKIDAVLGHDLWRQNPTNIHYDYRLIYERLRAIVAAREEGDVVGLIALLRSGLVRNLGNITSPTLFRRAYAGTKLLIEDYITQVALAVEFVTGLPPAQGYDASGWTSQAKLDMLHDTRQAFGRSTLVLQGGALFGLSHLGVVKALHLRGLLPRIITGTATGALIAALVCIHTEEELLDFLNGDGIDLTAFTRNTTNTTNTKKTDTDNHDRASIASSSAMTTSTSSTAQQQEPLIATSDGGYTLLRTLGRRTRRYLREGYFLDVNVLAACVRANVGDLTFDEAYARTKRVLNIAIAPSGRAGVPSLLNYLTAPHVLIWSAALASNTSGSGLYAPVTLLCKDEHGTIVPWSAAQGITLRPTHTSAPSAGPAPERDTPLARVAELFNVNHFVVSQARPYIAPFLRREHPRGPAGLSAWPAVAATAAPLARLVALELLHRLAQLDSLGLLPAPLRRLLLDETIPGASITLAPDIAAGDFWRLLAGTPDKEALDYWIMRGERAVWPAVGALRVRCAVEVELERGYQLVRRRKPLDGDLSSLRPSVRKVGSRGSLIGRRGRANSAGQG